MRARRLAAAALAPAMLALAACQPPVAEAEAGSARAANLPLSPALSEPIASPDTTGAVWAATTASGAAPTHLVYGIPGQPSLLALDCLAPGSPEARLRITRHAAADAGAGALLALIGNGAIGRIEVEATRVDAGVIWRGEHAVADRGWTPLEGAREMTVTVPGAGLVRLNPSPLPQQLLAHCRAPALPAKSA